MEKLYSHFYFRGKADERNHVRLIHREIIDQYSLFYRLGILSEQFKNCPTKMAFLSELYSNFFRYDRLPSCIFVVLNSDDSDINAYVPHPNEYTMFIKNKYSHKLMRRVLLRLGYTINFVTSETFYEKSGFLKKKEVSRWSTFLIHR